jgi:hypothetical protein
MDRVRQQIDEQIGRVRAELQAMRERLERAEGIDSLDHAREYRERFGAWAHAKRRKRRPRDFDGGEPVPVEPRPNPTPLTGGAEAPIE